jgi:multidrug transporter EmrE-like cation transporter
MAIAGVAGFWVLYAATFCVFKRGSLSKNARIPCFIIGNVFGISATAVLMLLYKIMNANVAMGLTLGGGFIVSQFALSVVYKHRLTLAQYLGIGTVSAGIFMLILGKK